MCIRDSLWGIQLLNEPISESLWQMIRGKYLPHNPERAAGASVVPLEVLDDFYTRGYHKLREILPAEKNIVSVSYTHLDVYKRQCWYRSYPGRISTGRPI